MTKVQMRPDISWQGVCSDAHHPWIRPC